MGTEQITLWLQLEDTINREAEAVLSARVVCVCFGETHFETNITKSGTLTGAAPGQPHYDTDRLGGASRAGTFSACLHGGAFF